MPPSHEQQSESSPEARFMTLDEVATFLAVSSAQVYALVRSGELPAMKIGGRGVWRVDRNQLETFVAKAHEETREWTRSHPFNPREESS